MGFSLEQAAIEPTDYWRVVDRWWTSEPVERLYIGLRAPDGSSAAVYWSPSEGWGKLVAEPPSEGEGSRGTVEPGTEEPGKLREEKGPSGS